MQPALGKEHHYSLVTGYSFIPRSMVSEDIIHPWITIPVLFCYTSFCLNTSYYPGNQERIEYKEASDRNCPWFDSSILWHSGIWRAAEIQAFLLVSLSL